MQYIKWKTENINKKYKYNINAFNALTYKMHLQQQKHVG
jgi:hypothetical protein